MPTSGPIPGLGVSSNRTPGPAVAERVRPSGSSRPWLGATRTPAHRALPAWMTLMAYGRSGYRELVVRCCTLAQQLGQGIEHSPQLELLCPVSLNIVCFTLRGADTAQRDQFLEAFKADGTALLTPTHFAGKPAVRAAFVNWSTSEEDVARILGALERCARQVL